MSKELIILKEKEDNFSNVKFHQQGFERFFENNNTELDMSKINVFNGTSHTLATDLCEFGYISILKDEDSFMIYIPENTNEFQYNWFKENEEKLRLGEIHFAIVTDHKIIKVSNDFISNDAKYDKLITKIEQSKKITNTNMR